ncbi:hypothetical protein JHK87_001081 [Glycine soja]|nr:hypothetical protein JHK87_001081 [Glycine soja]
MSSDNNEDELLQSGNEMSTMAEVCDNRMCQDFSRRVREMRETRSAPVPQKFVAPKFRKKLGMLFQYEVELDAFLEFLIWRFSIWVDKPTPGIALLNLRYRDEHVVEPRDKDRKV